MLCYVLFPLSSLLLELSGSEIWRNWIDVAWLVLLAVATTPRERRHFQTRGGMKLGAGFVLVALAALCIAFGALTGGAPLVTAAMEAKPVFYLLVALLLTRKYELPTPRAYCSAGAVLAVILMVETVVRSVAAGALIRPSGSGEVNYDGALLALSLVFALSRPALARKFGPIIFLGLLASFSRTSLLAACAVLLFARSFSVTLRLVMVGTALGAGLVSFLIRDLEIGSLEGMDRYWMWAVGIEYLAEHLWGHALSFMPGAGIKVDVPRFIAELWTDQQEKVNVDGIFPFHFHAMWLRLAISWGWGLAILLLLWLAYQAFVRPLRSADARPYFMVFSVLGLTMGLLYLGNVAVPYLLALNLVLSDSRRRQQLAARARQTTRRGNIAYRLPNANPA